MLIADDDERLCRTMASGLAAAGYQVVTAKDGASAIAQASLTPPDMAIVDLEMPTGGLEVIRELKRMGGAAIHVIVMTGHDDELRRRDAFDAGTNDFVVKPTGLAELKRRLAAASRTQREFVEIRLAKEATDRRMTYGAEATALLAHDLNNGLAVALSNVQYLAEAPGLDEDQRDALETTVRSLRRMSGLVANFVDIARFEDAAVKPLVTVVRVARVVESVFEVTSAVVNKGVAIRIDCAPTLEARFDQALVERVLHNLVGNAARYCNAGGEILVTATPWNHPETGVQLVVQNTGPLVPPAVAANLFNKYVRGAGGKRGMGLYFCRLVAEAHGGDIMYQATATGPSFVLRLPGRA